MKNNHKVEIIAEIGVNHDGSFEKSIKLIQNAKKSGADTVKFQTLFASEFVKRDTKKVLYQSKTTSRKESHYDMIKKLELEEYDFLRIINFCKKIKINFLSTPYDLKSLAMLKKLKAPRYKTSSADLVDIMLHKEIIKTRKPVIISTGASKLEEIEKTVKLYEKANQTKITLLHCVSNYPCNINNINLNVIKTLSKKFGYPVGYSDHSNSDYPAMISIALGAKVIERHFTLNKKSSGPDHKASSDPKDLLEYVNKIRLAEKILGSYKKKVQKEEEGVRKISRKSFTLRNSIKKGQLIKEKNLIMKRPGTGLTGNRIKEIIGKKVKRYLPEDYQAKKKDLYN